VGVRPVAGGLEPSEGFKSALARAEGFLQLSLCGSLKRWDEKRETMGRAVKIRKSYTGDRTFLSRLENAIERDTRLSPDERSGARQTIQQLISCLMELDKSHPDSRVTPGGTGSKKSVARAA
jgi:hypothetical protein